MATHSNYGRAPGVPISNPSKGPLASKIVSNHANLNRKHIHRFGSSTEKGSRTQKLPFLTARTQREGRNAAQGLAARSSSSPGLGRSGELQARSSFGRCGPAAPLRPLAVGMPCCPGDPAPPVLVDSPEMARQSAPAAAQAAATPWPWRRKGPAQESTSAAREAGSETRMGTSCSRIT
jgi:hypothetical protein